MGNELGRLSSYTEGRNNEIRHAGDKKWEIVKAAAALFIKQGTINTGVREIAEASGITVGTLYHYFKSKDDIISAFMDYAVFSTNDFLHEFETTLEHMDPAKALRYAMELYLDFTNDAQNIVLFWHQETRNLIPELRKRLIDNELVLLSIFEKIIERGCEKGVFRVQDTRLAAHNIIIMCDMWAFRRWDLGRRLTPDKFKRRQIDFIFNGLCGDSSKAENAKTKEVREQK